MRVYICIEKKTINSYIYIYRVKPAIISVNEMVKLSSSSSSSTATATAAASVPQEISVNSVTEDTMQKKDDNNNNNNDDGDGIHKKIPNKNDENRHKILQRRMQTILRYKSQRKIKTNFVSINSHYFIGSSNKDY